MKSLSIYSRIGLAIASLSMIAAWLTPLWQIQLWAPQYPEGLNMKIWHNRLGGSFDIINGLNHYIGMREIKAEMFPEFDFLGILIGCFIVLGLLAALWGKRAGLQIFIGTAFALGAAALWDFYRWGYDYGHNLDPHAAIRVPGMTYQPPVVGYKNLLNFTAYSGPDTGGWIIIGAGAIAVFLLASEIYFSRKNNRTPEKGGLKNALIISTGTLIAVTGMSACTTGPEPIVYGRDACQSCKMTMTDNRFGAELVTTTGKIYKFDDMNCLAGFVKSGSVQTAKIAGTYGIDFYKAGSFVDLQNAYLLQNEAIKSPMRSDIAVLASESDRIKLEKETGGGKQLTWNDYLKSE